MTLEKRLLSRIPLFKEIKVTCRALGLEFVSGQLKDLSGSGVQLEFKADLALPLDTLLELSLSEADLPFARAQVVRQNGLAYGLVWLEVFGDMLPKGWIVKDVL